MLEEGDRRSGPRPPRKVPPPGWSTDLGMPGTTSSDPSKEGKLDDLSQVMNMAIPIFYIVLFHVLILIGFNCRLEGAEAADEIFQDGRYFRGRL